MKLCRFTIREGTTPRTYREGYQFFGSLRGAKASASRNQFFQGTILSVENDLGELVAFKKAGVWVNLARPD